ncbi:MAG TPA: hypothetical protein VNF69_02950 [Burkholderiales bacterium]|nr:hypothetical protein [Burkholderiales bacterium]
MLNWLAGCSPQALLVGFALLGVVLALPLEIAAVRRLRRAQLARGTLLLLFGAAVLLLGVLAALVAASLHSYSRLTHEQEAARVALRRLGPQDFALTLQTPGAAPHHYELRGDEWQIDARVLKWRALGVLVGFDTVYRLERLSGRYADPAADQTAVRTVHALAGHGAIEVDLWSLLRRYHDALPFADALYGSAGYAPMANGARYVVTVSASGLVVRPENDAARRAVENWR